MIEPEPNSQWETIVKSLQTPPSTVVSYPGSHLRPVEDVALFVPVPDIQIFRDAIEAFQWWMKNTPLGRDEVVPFRFPQDGEAGLIKLGNHAWYEQIGEVQSLREDGLVLRNPKILVQARRAGRIDVMQAPGTPAFRRIRVRPYPAELATLVASYETGFLQGIYGYTPELMQLSSAIPHPLTEVPQVTRLKPGSLSTTPAQRALYLLFKDQKDTGLVSHLRTKIESNS